MLTVEAQLSQVSGRLGCGEPGEQAHRQPFRVFPRVQAALLIGEYAWDLTDSLYMEYTSIQTVTAVAQPAASRAPADQLPTEESAFTDVWADGGAQWRT